MSFILCFIGLVGIQNMILVNFEIRLIITCHIFLHIIAITLTLYCNIKCTLR